MAGKLFVVSGPSGVGKGTLLALVLPELDGIQVVVSVTTRQPRTGEVDGVDYFFVTDEEFDKLIAEDGLLEWAAVHGARYGTLRSEVLTALSAGQDVVLEIDPQGARQVKDHYPDAVLLFIMPPSLDELRRRLVKRGTESEEAIDRRVAAAASELQAVGEYDKLVINDDLTAAADELRTYMLSRRA